MKELVLFLMTFLLVFFIYRIFIVGKAKRKNSKKKPIEVTYLISRYKLDLEKIEYKKLLMIVSIVSSIDISILVTIITLFDNTLIQIILAFVLIIPVILISYGLIGKYYKKRGLTKND